MRDHAVVGLASLDPAIKRAVIVSWWAAHEDTQDRCIWQVSLEHLDGSTANPRSHAVTTPGFPLRALSVGVCAR